MKALPGPEGGVVAALLAGEQTAVDKDIAQAMRDSGLAHILSISGLHIVFVVALVMGLVRYTIALVPPLSLRIDAKKIAAVLALMAALFYTALAGAPVPAQRACAMAGFALLAHFSTAGAAARAWLQRHTLRRMPATRKLSPWHYR
jgi:competence protein ComEC